MNPDTPENPKEANGRAKCPMHLLPPVFMRQTAEALAHGASRYGAFNWRRAGINATTYVAAIMRHLTAWQDGEDNDPDSGLSHIAHIAANAAIVLDAANVGMMNDDRAMELLIEPRTRTEAVESCKNAFRHPLFPPDFAVPQPNNLP